MTKQHKKYMRKVLALCAIFNANWIDVNEFNKRLHILINTGKQINYI